MGTGNDGLRRIVEAGVIPGWLIQKYLNNWISCSYRLFGTDHSSSAQLGVRMGHQGPPTTSRRIGHDAKLDELNDD